MNDGWDVEDGAGRSQLLRKLITRTTGPAQSDEFPRMPRGARVPLCSAQARIWFMERMSPGTALYNHSNILHLDWWPERTVVEGAIGALMKRHDALRLRIFE